MTDILVRQIPLPQPRPNIDDIPVDPRIFFDRPITQLEDIYSHTEKVGTELIKQQWKEMTEMFNRMLDLNIYELFEGLDKYLHLGLLITALSILGGLALYVVVRIIRYFIND